MKTMAEIETQKERRVWEEISGWMEGQVGEWVDRWRDSCIDSFTQRFIHCLACTSHWDVCCIRVWHLAASAAIPTVQVMGGTIFVAEVPSKADPDFSLSL